MEIVVNLRRKLTLFIIIMKKTLFALVMSVIMIGLASCGGNNGHSKAFNESKKILDNVKEEVQKAKDCDELDMATFGILGLLGVEGVDEMPDAEQEELSKITEEIDKVLEAKKVELNCQDDDSWFEDDEEMPFELEEEVME